MRQPEQQQRHRSRREGRPGDRHAVDDGAQPEHRYDEQERGDACRREPPAGGDVGRDGGDDAECGDQQIGLLPLRADIADLAAAPRDGGVLGRRETDIAELVADGLTNRRIAAAARISERTVESHVQHVLAKLGFTGRSQIAAWSARRTR